MRLKNHIQRSKDYKISLIDVTYSTEEICEVMDSLISGKVTQGKKVQLFENMFSKYIGREHSIMVNSGSSAILLALSVLSDPMVKNRIKPGDEIIVPAVTWPTTIYPVINIGAVPVLVDVHEDYQISIDGILNEINRKTKAIIPVHLLGDACDMKAIRDIAEEKNLFLIEDCCESLGTKIGNKYVGNFSDISVFSFYFSHHITTIEGGMLTTNNENFGELARILRAHGYIRDIKNKRLKDAYINSYPNIDQRFLFVNIGFNFRCTEIQAAFGLHQLRKLRVFNKVRSENAKLLTKKLKKYEDCLRLPEKNVPWFAYPITVKNSAPFSRDDLVCHLEKHSIETRPLVAGNLAEQPAFKILPKRISGNLKNSEYIMRNSFYIGNNPTLKKSDIEFIAHVIDKFMEKNKLNYSSK